MEARTLIWDLPTRLFHWWFVVAFAGAFGIGNLLHGRDPTFAVHAFFGCILALAVLLRLTWGFVGSRHARFVRFPCGPRSLYAYLKGIIRGDAPRFAGHNPGAAVATLLMLALALAIATTGAFVGSVPKLKGVHNLLAFSLLGVIGLHVAGLVLHRLRHRDNLPWSMIDGHKLADPAEAIPSSCRVAGVVFIVLIGLATWGLVHAYDPATRRVTLPLVGSSILLARDPARSEFRPEKVRDQGR
jgi:cytochrome b